MGIFQPERYQIQTGPRFTSIPVTLDGSLATLPFNVFTGFGYGFMFANATPQSTDSTFLIASLRGINNIGNDKLIVQPNAWYTSPFQSLELLPNPFVIGQGSFICNIATMPDAKIYPVSALIPPTAAQGGGGAISRVTTAQNLTGTAPTTAADGIALGTSFGQLYSMYTASIQVVAGVVTGGGVDIWRYDSFAAKWVLVLQNLLLPTGQAIVGIPNDSLGVRTEADRLQVVPNGISVTGGATTVSVTIEVQ